MLSCTSSNKLTTGNKKDCPKFYRIKKIDKLWNGVEHWATNHTSLPVLILLLGYMHLNWGNNI